MNATTHAEVQAANRVDYQVDPNCYKHWKVQYDGPVATLTLDIDEDNSLPYPARTLGKSLSH